MLEEAPGAPETIRFGVERPNETRSQSSQNELGSHERA
jgi:hypothetical protein